MMIFENDNKRNTNEKISFSGLQTKKKWSNKGDVLHDSKRNAFIIISIKQGRIAKEKGDGFFHF